MTTYQYWTDLPPKTKGYLLDLCPQCGDAFCLIKPPGKSKPVAVILQKGPNGLPKALQDRLSRMTGLTPSESTAASGLPLKDLEQPSNLKLCAKCGGESSPTAK